MILTAVFSKPLKELDSFPGRTYLKAKLKLKGTVKSAEEAQKEKSPYLLELFTEKQAFQKNLSLKEAEEFYSSSAGKAFKNTVCTTETEEITVLVNRHGEAKTLRRKISSSENTNAEAEAQNKSAEGKNQKTQNSLTSPKEKLLKPQAASSDLFSQNRRKNYILEEGKPVPFLVKLGVMTEEGKIISAKYDKFRQINRFLEFIKDILPEVTRLCTQNRGFTDERPLYIADFGCGKSYLTFAVYYYLNELLHIPVEITGLDLKKDVIEHCSSLAREFGYKNLHFDTGDVKDAEKKYKNPPDIMITLHACDTATDYALEYAVNQKTSAILSVPCCQHEINLQLKKNESSESNLPESPAETQISPFASLKKWGILQERFSALATDAIRAELLEQKNYSVQLLEFIDTEGTPKNLLIRAVRREKENKKAEASSSKRMNALINELNVNQTLVSLFKDSN